MDQLLVRLRQQQGDPSDFAQFKASQDIFLTGVVRREEAVSLLCGDIPWVQPRQAVGTAVGTRDEVKKVAPHSAVHERA